MIRPKQPGFYPNRDVDCQAAVAQGIADLIEQATLSGTSEADASAALAEQNVPGIRDLIEEAKAVGWQEAEVANAIKIVAAGMANGYAGFDPEE
ncbi:hypothetical protein ACI0FS_14880 [Ochrobactrum quorumnocens]|uniref:hypothetical protein n=1 Tax=Ochrobactrum quorumnocens TaxID=271865 RepID=UPI003852183A